MKNKISPTVIGLFVLGALLLAVISLFAFGGINFFSKPERFVVYFDETIHGLDNGSPVKLRGVRIGRVVGMNVRAIPLAQGEGNDKSNSVVAVVCELSRDVVADGSGRPVDVSDRQELQRLIDDGLRAQLGIAGLATGLLYVELDFYDIVSHPAILRKEIESPYIEMPAVPSAIAEFQANLTEVLNDLRRIDFEGLGKNIDGLLVDTRRQVNAIDVAGLAREWSATARSVRSLVDSPETRAVVVNLASATARFDRVLAGLETSVGTGAEQFTLALQEVRGALSEFTETTLVLKRFVVAQQSLGHDASGALNRLGEAAAAVARLADFLERNPTALLSGRAAEQAKP
ncbi:MAG: MCE family protein [Verrucomicrobia bacterium]|nr:MAG: MCE family protein [Verrucomicrobiota bacterium]